MSTHVLEQLVEGRNYVYGEFRVCRRPAMDSFDNINPSTGESLGEFPQSTEHEVAENETKDKTVSSKPQICIFLFFSI